MAPDFATCREMVKVCQKADVKLLIHENFRWQAPLRQLKAKLQSGVIGDPFKARVAFVSAFPVFGNQPILAELEQFILADIGSHIFDACRFLFGETDFLFCQTARINPDIKGEDVANVLMRVKNGMVCYAEMSYASLLENEAFPQTLVTVEGERGSLVLSHDFILKTTTKTGTSAEVCKPVAYPWLNPDYAVVHSSIVDCNRNLLADLQGHGKAETTAEDNFETIRLIYAAYDSARDNKVIHL
jgi:predicted dehydrogenase